MVSVMPMGPITALEYINTAVAVATFLFSERLPVTLSNIKAFFTRTRKEPPADFQADEAERLIKLLVINPELLTDLAGYVENAVQKYRECLKKAARPQERDVCDRRAERDICETLNRIMSRNQGELPTGYLNHQWESFGCAKI